MSNYRELKALGKPVGPRMDESFGKECDDDEWKERTAEMEVISTGSIGFGCPLGIGKEGNSGNAGWKAVGKTTLCIHVTTEAQRRWYVRHYRYWTCLWWLVCSKAWVDVDNLLISQPDYGAGPPETADRLILSERGREVIIDSVAALVPKGELEGRNGVMRGSKEYGATRQGSWAPGTEKTAPLIKQILFAFY